MRSNNTKSNGIVINMLLYYVIKDFKQKLIVIKYAVI